ncbi:MAG: hypothetical protein ACR2PX_10550 [Endozoicomonas sp.]|uniref:hypothetical protein n=1 Tax=Endozoicomonas sp. TaxID=1892382 RepID=UPI003D9BBD5F
MMQENINKVEWKSPSKVPPYESQFFVAVKYPNGLGTYDLIPWDGKKWVLGYTAEVVGWVTMTDFMASIKAGWPEWDECNLSVAE